MNIVMLTGSPHRRGTSALLADKFVEGINKKGLHRIYRFDAAFKNVNYCIGCDKCGSGEAHCIYDDDFSDLASRLIEADMLVFVTPVYYHDMSAQLKTVLDRFHGINSKMRSRKRKVVLMATAFQPGEWVVDGLKEHFRTTSYYMGWEMSGSIFALDCDRREDIESSDYPRQAYELAISL